MLLFYALVFSAERTRKPCANKLINGLFLACFENVSRKDRCVTDKTSSQVKVDPSLQREGIEDSSGGASDRREAVKNKGV